MRTFYEFFAGGGMSRAGLGGGWTCLFANDVDDKKCRAYRENWGGEELTARDVRDLAPGDLPGRPGLVWGSFPCQDLSLAGVGAGLGGARSGTFWPFWTLMRAMVAEGRAPAVIVLENVCGTITSHGGRDFAAICDAFRRTGYRCGAMVIDAALFVPQSRPRLFVIGVRTDIPTPAALEAASPQPCWHPAALVGAHGRLPAADRDNWAWWTMPPPATRETSLADVIEDEPTGARWHTGAETARLLDMMSAVNRAKVEKARMAGRRMVGAVYRRTRRDENGDRIQRAEVRFDDVAGCLRTPAGGSSRQLIMVVDGPRVRSRLISTRETARLMGLPDDYRLPLNYNEAYHLTGDGVVVPVVRRLAAHLVEPVLDACGDAGQAAA